MESVLTLEVWVRQAAVGVASLIGLYFAAEAWKVRGRDRHTGEIAWTLVALLLLAAVTSAAWAAGLPHA